MPTERPALFDPKRENLRELGRMLAQAFPVDPHTPPAWIKLLGRIK